MNIEIKVDEVSLSTIVAEVVNFDEEGDAYPSGKEKTVADLVADRITERLVRDDHYPPLRDQVMQIRAEEIRSAVRPTIDEALTRPLFKTNTYGERIGAETTLNEVIVEESRKQLCESTDRYNRGGETVLQRAIRVEVTNVLDHMVKEAVAKALASTEVAERIATVVKEATTS